MHRCFLLTLKGKVFVRAALIMQDGWYREAHYGMNLTAILERLEGALERAILPVV